MGAIRGRVERDGTAPESGAGFARALAGIALGALVLRLAVRMAAGAQDYWQSGYEVTWWIAREIAAGHGYALPGGAPTAYRVPLYPLFLAGVTGGNDWPGAVIAVQATIGAGTVACAGLIARRLFGTRAGLVAAALCALWPYYVLHDTALQETALFAFLSAAATLVVLVAGGIRSGLAAGALLGLSLLTRATILPFALFACVWLAWQRGARPALAAALALGLVAAPWLVWSSHVEGRAGFGTELGASLYAGNHDLTFAAYPERSIDESRALIFDAIPADQQARLAAMKESAASDWYKDRAGEWIAAHPVQFLTGAVRKLWAAFGPWPVPRHGLLSDLAYAVTWLPLLGLGLAGLWADRSEWRRDLVFTVQFAAFAGMTALLWAQTSHRSPLDVHLIVFASRILARLRPFARLPLAG